MPNLRDGVDWVVKRISALTRTATDANLTDDEYMAVDDASAYTRKITVASLATWVLGRIKSLATSITSFRTGDVIPVDGPDGTAKMSKDDLLARTAENALAGNAAAVFDPTRDEGHKYLAGERVEYNGKVYTFKVDHYGAWNSSKVIQLPDTEAFVGKVDGGSVEKYSGTLTASNYNLLTNRIYRKNLPISVTLTISGKVNLAFNGNSAETFYTAGTYERVYTPDVDVSRIGFYVYGLPTSVNIDLTVTDGFFSLVDNISNDLGEEFSTASSYPVGYLVSYFKKLYMFVKTKATGAWNSSLCVPVKIIDLISKLKEDIIKPFFIEKNNVEEYSFTFSDGGYIRAHKGDYIADAKGHCTDYIRVSPGDRVYLAVSINNSGAKVACYDFWKNYLPSSSLITDESYAGIFEVPNGVSYIRISSRGSLSYTAYNIPKYNLVPLQKNSDLNVLVFGDSITEDFYFTINSSGETTAVSPHTTIHNWSYYSNIHLNFKELRNYAKSGASYKDHNFGTWDRMSIAEQVLVAINDKTNPQNVWSENNFEPDIIIFAAGTNDGVPNDTPESALAKIVYDEDGSVNTTATLAALNRSKFCEAVMWSMLKIRIEFPYALGLCLLPIQRCANDVPFGDVNSYLTTMARRYGFIPVDGISECGIVKDNNKKSAAGDTLSDGLHPNTDGAKMMARMMIQAIDRYFYPVFRD